MKEIENIFSHFERHILDSDRSGYADGPFVRIEKTHAVGTEAQVSLKIFFDLRT